MNSYLGLEALTQLHIEQLHRDAEKARLAALAARVDRPGYRQQLAQSLRAFARHVDPTCEPSVGRNPLSASPANAGC
jgi:hypothetical protein